MSKRVFDLIISSILIILFSPIFLIISAAIMVSMGRPVLFIQERPGKNNKIFKLYKFRTMLENQPKHKIDDQRISILGNWLRKSSLDEIPELFNVLKGDMSLVGPRPLLKEYIPFYSNEQIKRHNVLPGITGWAQIKGRNLISWDEKFKFDVWYVNNQSLILDLKIILITFYKVLLRQGINTREKKIMPRFDIESIKQKKGKK